MKPKVSKFWENAGAQLRRDIVHDYGCRLECDKVRDANGDICGMENFRAVMRAKGVDRDILLEVDVDNEPEDKRLDGLSLSAFQGLAWGDPPPDLQPFTERVSYAVFKNGRALRLLNYRTPLIEDASEKTWRELAYSRKASTPMHDSKKTVTNQAKKGQSKGGRKHGFFYDDDSNIRKHDERKIKEKFRFYVKEEGMTSNAASVEVAGILDSDALLARKERRIQTIKPYAGCRCDHVKRLMIDKNAWK